MTPDQDIDTEYTYEPERWHRPAKQATADASLIDERDMLRGIVRGLLADGVHSYRTNTGNQACTYCQRSVDGPFPFELKNPARHAPDCPWRQAAEYVARNAQGEGT